MNTPEEHAAAVMRAPGQITVASIAGAIRAYADEVKGSQIQHHRSQLETELQKHLSAAQGQIAELARQRDAEREARRALAEAGQEVMKFLDAAPSPDMPPNPALAVAMLGSALELAAKLP